MVAIYPSSESQIKSRIRRRFQNQEDLQQRSSSGNIHQGRNAACTQQQKTHLRGTCNGLPAKKKPLLIVYDVPNTFDDKLLLSSLRQQNFEGDQRENFNDAIRFSHKTGSRSGETTNYVLEVSPQFEKLYSNKTGSTSAATPCTSETTSQ